MTFFSSLSGLFIISIAFQIPQEKSGTATTRHDTAVALSLLLRYFLDPLWNAMILRVKPDRENQKRKEDKS